MLVSDSISIRAAPVVVFHTTELHRGRDEVLTSLVGVGKLWTRSGIVRSMAGPDWLQQRMPAVRRYLLAYADQVIKPESALRSMCFLWYPVPCAFLRCLFESLLVLVLDDDVASLPGHVQGWLKTEHNSVGVPSWGRNQTSS